MTVGPRRSQAAGANPRVSSPLPVYPQLLGEVGTGPELDHPAGAGIPDVHAEVGVLHVPVALEAVAAVDRVPLQRLYLQLAAARHGGELVPQAVALEALPVGSVGDG